MHYGVCLSSVDMDSDAALPAKLAYEAEQSGWDGAFLCAREAGGLVSRAICISIRDHRQAESL
jgi:hypothetical protein